MGYDGGGDFINDKNHKVSPISCFEYFKDGWMDHFAGLICLVLIIHKGCVDMTSLI